MRISGSFRPGRKGERLSYDEVWERTFNTGQAIMPLVDARNVQVQDCDGVVLAGTLSLLPPLSSYASHCIL